MFGIACFLVIMTMITFAIAKMIVPDQAGPLVASIWRGMLAAVKVIGIFLLRVIQVIADNTSSAIKALLEQGKKQG